MSTDPIGLKRVIMIWEKAHGSDYSELALPINNLAAIYTAQAKYTAAEPLFKRALAIWGKNLGPNHDSVVIALVNLTQIYEAMGMDAEAERYRQRAIEAQTQAQ